MEPRELEEPTVGRWLVRTGTLQMCLSSHISLSSCFTKEQSKIRASPGLHLGAL